MSTDASRKYRPSKGFLVTIGVIAFFLLLPIWSTTSEKNPKVLAMANLRQFWFALSLYAEKHEDRLPPLLSKLTLDYMDSAALPKLRYVDPDSGRRYDWLYYPRDGFSALPADTILAASPTTITRKERSPTRLVLYRDGSVTSIDEDAFQSALLKAFGSPSG